MENVGEAKAKLASLLRRVERGETIVIARAGRAVAQLIPFGKRKRRLIGLDDGLGYIAEDFDAPLPDQVLAAFYGGTPPKA
jgi:prevent-host-death family protein